MKKSEILRDKGIKLRRVNMTDRKLAKTDYQRNANFIVTTSNGRQFYSKNGSLKDALECEKFATKTPVRKIPPKQRQKRSKRLGQAISQKQRETRQGSPQARPLFQKEQQKRANKQNLRY